MKIVSKVYVCPKCAKEFVNESLLSYSSGFEEEVKEFLNNNKTITECDVCNEKLIEK